MNSLQTFATEIGVLWQVNLLIFGHFLPDRHRDCEDRIQGIKNFRTENCKFRLSLLAATHVL